MTRGNRDHELDHPPRTVSNSAADLARPDRARLHRRLARAATPERDGRILVVIQLNGGNDGLNTVVPFGDEAYARNRKTLKLGSDRLIKISDGIGLHPAMGAAGKLIESGRLGIVPGVGYPNPNRSHFASMAIWQTARLDEEEHGGPGWLGRGLDTTPGASSTFVGPESIPVAIRGRRRAASSLDRIEDLTLDPSVARPEISTGGDDLAGFVRRSVLDAYASSDRLAELARERSSSARYPDTTLANRLKLIARLIKGGYDSRVFYTSQTGYDTHSHQSGTHFELLSELSAHSRLFSTTWPSRSSRTAFWRSASASLAAGFAKTHRLEPITALPAPCSWPGRQSNLACWANTPA